VALLDQISAFWEMESGALTTDATANAQTLTNVNSLTSSGTGPTKVGNYASFSGGTGYFTHADSSALELCGGDFSISFWYYSPATGNQYWMINKRTSSNPGREYQIGINGGNLFFAVFDGTTTGFNETTASEPSATTWHHIVGTYVASSNTNSLYIDNGTPTTSTSASITPLAGSGTFAIGTRAWSNGTSNFDGRMDQVGLWKRALSSGEVSQLYNSGNGLSYAAMQPAAGLLSPNIYQFPKRQSLRRAANW
jgi:hypothetical protein